MITLSTVQHYLTRWGAYMRADQDAGLDYPSIEIMYSQACPRGSELSPDEPEGVREIQRIYFGMDNPMQEIIHISYWKNYNQVKAAAKLGISRPNYKVKLAAAENYVRGCMQTRRDFV